MAEIKDKLVTLQVLKNHTVRNKGYNTDDSGKTLYVDSNGGIGLLDTSSTGMDIVDDPDAASGELGGAVVGNGIWESDFANFQGSIISSQPVQPTDEHNKIWINTAESATYEVPTYEEFGELKEDITAHDTRITALENNPAVDPSLELRVEKLEAAAEGNLYIFREDAEEAYEKTVPADAMKWATLDSVGGKTVNWNQLLPNKDINYTSSTFEITGNLNGEITVVVKKDITKGTESGNIPGGIGIPVSISGHKVFKMSNSEFLTLGVKNVYVTNDGITTSNTITSSYCNISITAKKDTPAGTYTLRTTMNDLTQMFGAGNEPTSTSDPRTAWIEAYAEAHPEYNAGQLVSFEPSAVVSKDSNGDTIAEYDLSSVTLPTDIEVESGGTLTFESDGTQMPLPNKETYMIKTALGGA